MHTEARITLVDNSLMEIKYIKDIFYGISNASIVSVFTHTQDLLLALDSSLFNANIIFIRDNFPDSVVIDLLIRLYHDKGIQIPCFILSNVKTTNAGSKVLKYGAKYYLEFHRMMKNQYMRVKRLCMGMADVLNVSDTIFEQKGIIIPNSDEQIVYNLYNKKNFIRLIVIGISTGGPEALKYLFSFLNPHIKIPIVIMQHMAGGFDKELLYTLKQLTPIHIYLAHHEQQLQHNSVYIAQANRQLKIVQKNALYQFELGNTIVHEHQPLIDILFTSASVVAGRKVLGIIMTGMGTDGAEGLLAIRKIGGLTIGQDKLSSTVYGMPQYAKKIGAVEKQLSLDDIIITLNTLA